MNTSSKVMKPGFQTLLSLQTKTNNDINSIFVHSSIFLLQLSLITNFLCSRNANRKINTTWAIKFWHMLTVGVKLY